MNEKEQEIANALIELILSNTGRPNCMELINAYRGIIVAAKDRKEMEAWKSWNPMTALATGIRDATPE